MSLELYSFTKMRQTMTIINQVDTAAVLRFNMAADVTHLMDVIKITLKKFYKLIITVQSN